jgi:branched-chain amino acid transport system permease protein
LAEEKITYRRERIDRGIKARADTIFVISSYRDILYLLLPRVLPVVALLVLPLILPYYWSKVFTHTCMIALLALSWDLLASIGLVSFGQAALFGAGAYISGALNHYFHLPYGLAILIGIFGGATLGSLLLSPVVRLKGVYFAIFTLILSLLSPRIIESTDILGGSHGLAPIALFGSDLVATYVAVGAVLVCLFGFRRLIDEDYGAVMRAIRDDDRAVMSAGINIYWRKIQALFIASAVGSFAGAFTTHHFGFVGMTVFSLDYSILPLASAVLGGAGTFAGALTGAMILVPLSESLRAVGGLRIVCYCIILIAAVVYLPEGIFHYIARKYHQFERVVKV